MSTLLRRIDIHQSDATPEAVPRETPLAVAVLSAALPWPLAPERWAGRVRGD